MPVKLHQKGEKWRSINLDETENQIRARVIMPNQFQSDSFRIKILDETKGISLVIGRLKNKTTTTIQSYRFDKNKNWTIQKAISWLNENAKNRGN